MTFRLHYKSTIIALNDSLVQFYLMINGWSWMILIVILFPDAGCSTRWEVAWTSTDQQDQQELPIEELKVSQPNFTRNRKARVFYM